MCIAITEYYLFFKLGAKHMFIRLIFYKKIGRGD